MKNPKLSSPSYKQISLAAISNPGDSLTLINLGSFKTIKAIEKGEIIAAGIINSSNIEFKSFEYLESGASEIYAIISGQNHSGPVSLTINSNILSETIEINEENCCNIFSLYYGQNFESLSSVKDFCKTENITATLENETNEKYIEINSRADKIGKFYSIEDLNIPSKGSYILEFEASIANVNKSESSSFFILTEQSNTDSYLLKMTSNTYNNGNDNMKWIINDSDKTIELSSGFFHYKLIVDRIINKISLSIYTLDDKVLINKEIINKSASSATDIAKCFCMILPSGTRGTIKLNNISVYSYENAQISTFFKEREIKVLLGASFTEKEIKISLNDLSLIIEVVNKSSYCTASFADTEVTIKSKKAGKTYMYFSGILKKNDNKALVLVIIDIDQSGSITYDNKKIYYFSTDINYNKIPSTVQKEYHTDSSINGVDTSEPNDNPNIKPCVNVNELNSKFA